MALFKCIECNKSISDKAKSCPNCGHPLNAGNRINNYKKFDFNYIKELKKDNRLLEHQSVNAKKAGKKFYLIGLVLLFLSIFIINVSTSNAGGLFGAGIFLFSLASLFLGREAYKSVATENSIEELIKDRYYNNKILKMKSAPVDLDYSVISSINTESEEDLLDEAYSLQADALIDINIQKYTTSNTKSHFNGIGVERSIKTEIEKYENWTAVAVRINSNKYHDPMFAS